MQTFLPYKSFEKTAKVLDMKRLGKQRVEAYQILQCLFGEKEGWKNYPAVKMWKGYEMALLYYADAICREWLTRGYKDSIREKLRVFFFAILADPTYTDELTVHLPPWVGKKIFHDSHRSNLMRKKPEYYQQYKWKVPNDLPYVWPTKQKV